MVAYIPVQTDVGVSGDLAGEIAGIKGVIAAEAGHRTLRRHGQGRGNQPRRAAPETAIQRIQSVAGVSRTLPCPVLHE
jgi:hypothetical protein